MTVADIESITIEGNRVGGYEFTWSLSVSEEKLKYKLKLDFAYEDIPSDTRVTIIISPSVSDAF